MLAVLGFVTILLVLALIMSKKVSTLVALIFVPAITGFIDFAPVAEAAWFGLPIEYRLHRSIHQCPQCHHPSRTGCCRKGRNCLC